jgi:hypothetical protein
MCINLTGDEERALIERMQKQGDKRARSLLLKPSTKPAKHQNITIAPAATIVKPTYAYGFDKRGKFIRK